MGSYYFTDFILYNYQWPVHNKKLHPGIQKRLLAWLALLAFEICFEGPATHELIHPSPIRPSFRGAPTPTQFAVPFLPCSTRADFLTGQRAQSDPDGRVGEGE